MATSRRLDPLQEAFTLQEAMNQLFSQSFVQPGWIPTRSHSFPVPVDVLEGEQAYHVYALLPGMKPEDIELTVQGTTLTLKGQLHSFVKPEQQVRWLAQEISTGSFERSLTFPRAIDSEHIETSYEQGMLMLTLPIHESNRPRRISITSHQQEQTLVEAGTS
ncbi:MAG: hypothetical protein NVSMB33_08360 [Ktedonobacteraceae bacterium]